MQKKLEKILALLFILTIFCCSKNPIDSNNLTSPQIVYTNLNYDIFIIKNIYHPRPIQLTNDGSNFMPKLSPQGDKIAYFCDNPEYFDTTRTYATALFTITTDGENRKFLTERSKYNQHALTDLSWSPDGSKLAYISPLDGVRDDQNIWIIDVNGENKQKITSGGWNLDPRWFPEGAKIAYSKPCSVPGFMTSYIINISNGNNKQFYQEITEGLCFDSESKYIAFDYTPVSRVSELISEIYISNIDGTDAHPITFDENRINRPIGFSVDGEQIYFLSYLEIFTYYSTAEISVIDINGSNRKILKIVNNIGKAILSQDRSKILLFIWQVDIKPRVFGLYVLSVDGKEFFKVAENVRFADWR